MLHSVACGTHVFSHSIRTGQEHWSTLDGPHFGPLQTMPQSRMFVGHSLLGVPSFTKTIWPLVVLAATPL